MRYYVFAIMMSYQFVVAGDITNYLVKNSRFNIHPKAFWWTKIGDEKRDEWEKGRTWNEKQSWKNRITLKTKDFQWAEGWSELEILNKEEKATNVDKVDIKENVVAVEVRLKDLPCAKFLSEKLRKYPD